MRPKIGRQDVVRILAKFGVQDPVALVGIRGYYLDSQGKAGTNDRGIYDDAIILITPKSCISFVGNTDPSVFRPGIATMKPGVHRYYKGKHKQRYWALRLVGETVPVTRDGQTGTKTGVALNIHKGGFRTTGSEGCQTIHPQYWDEFIELVYDAMDAAGMKTIPYCLIEEVERRRDARPAKSAADPVAAAAVPPAPVSDVPASSSPQNAVPAETAVSVEAPVKEGSTAAATKLVIAGFTVPAALQGAVTAAQSAITNGFISPAEVGATVLAFIRENTHYAFWGIGLIIAGLLLKKFYKQVTFWLQMYFAASPAHQSVEVKKQ
jgi:hypothetical protein